MPDGVLEWIANWAATSSTRPEMMEIAGAGKRQLEHPLDSLFHSKKTSVCVCRAVWGICIADENHPGWFWDCVVLLSPRRDTVLLLRNAAVLSPSLSPCTSSTFSFHLSSPAFRKRSYLSSPSLFHTPHALSSLHTPSQPPVYLSPLLHPLKTVVSVRCLYF